MTMMTQACKIAWRLVHFFSTSRQKTTKSFKKLSLGLVDSNFIVETVSIETRKYIEILNVKILKGEIIQSYRIHSKKALTKCFY